MKRCILLPLLTLLWMLPATALQGGKLDIVTKFGVTGNELDVATYTEGTGDNTQRVGLLSIALEKRGSFAFRRSEWDTLIKLFQKAEQTQSASWQFVGTMKETGTKDPTLLMVTAGPGVRFTMETANGSFTFLLAASDFGRFEASLRQAGAGLSD